MMRLVASLMRLLSLIVVPLTGALAQGPAGEPSGPWREQIHLVPMRDKDGGSHLLYTRICRPKGEPRARVALINHGLPPNPNMLPTMRPTACENEAMQWFLTRGYLVVAGMRRGYGLTGGTLVETHDAFCSAESYARAGQEGARDLDALVTYATALPYAQSGGVVVVGQSVGGWVTDAYDSEPHPKVVAMVSMAGGHGAHQRNMLNSNCRSGELARAAGMFGATASTPMLWVYAANDSYFAPAIATELHAAFTAAGGKAELIQTGPFGNEGHHLFFDPGGSAIWGPFMERYLASRRAGP